jgi:type IV pilus assembly protein PilW
MTRQLKRQSGLTLVELMIATTLSIVLLAGVLMVFSANKTTYRLQNGLGTLQENGRYAMRQITADLQLAGFGGCLSPSLEPRIAVLASSAPTRVKDFADGEFFSGQDNKSGAATYGGVTMLGGTDSVEIRGPLRSSVSFVTGETLTTGTVELIGVDTGFSANDYVALSDCAGADIFHATAVATSGGNTQVSHGGGSNTQATLSRLYGADSVATELVSHTYFIGTVTRASGQVVNVLFRFDGTSSQEIVDGVSNLQVEYALDTDGNGVIDIYCDPGDSCWQTNSWSKVVAIKVWLLADSVEDASAVVAPYASFAPSTTANPTPDNRLRQEFSTLVYVRNSVR